MEKVVAFDLDGTLSESDLFLIPSYKAALCERGLPVLSDERLKLLIGCTIENARAIVMPDRPMEEYLEYSRAVGRHVQDFVRQGRPYPGIPESLAKLRTRGYKVALCSNGESHYVYQVLDSLGLTQYFDFVQHVVLGCDKSDLLRRVIEKFAPAKVVMVGDRVYDVEAARNNAVPVIGCLYGLYPDEVRDADVRITAADQLPEAVEMLLG